MDITIFAWIFVIIFFLVYSAIQTQRCCKTLQNQITNRRNETTATINASQIYTVEGDIRQTDTTSSCRVSLSVGAIDMPLPCSRSNNRFYSNRNGIISDHDMKKDDGLPTYEEATRIAIDANNNDSNNQSIRANASEIPSSSAQTSAATPSPSVVINIETHIANPST